MPAVLNERGDYQRAHDTSSVHELGIEKAGSINRGAETGAIAGSSSPSRLLLPGEHGTTGQ